MSTKFFTVVSLCLVFVIATAFVVAVTTFDTNAARAITNNNCYDLLNAAGQVVQTVCH